MVPSKLQLHVHINMSILCAACNYFCHTQVHDAIIIITGFHNV